MMAPRTPVSFIATDDPDAAQAFYGTALGLALREAGPFALVFDDGGHVLRVQIVPSLAPAPFTAHGWQVTDIVAEIRALTGKGVTFEHFDGMAQDAHGIWTTPGGDKIAWFKDPSGNILSLTQHSM